MFNIKEIIKEEVLNINNTNNILNEIELNVNELLTEQEDYRGSHTAPNKENDSPMHDLTNTYPDDIYDGPQKAARYYGDGFPFDIYSAYIIQSARNKPNKQIKIYRAVPDFNKDIDKEIKERYNITRYFDKYGFLPQKNNIVNRLWDKWDKLGDYTGEKYDEGIQNILKDIYNEINELSKKKQNKLTINDGDWVTINPAYAKEHGQSNLNNKFKILTKTVRANQLYTDGNSMHEWGYNI
jgi:hypothetical protein